MCFCETVFFIPGNEKKRIGKEEEREGKGTTMAHQLNSLLGGEHFSA